MINAYTGKNVLVSNVMPSIRKVKIGFDNAYIYRPHFKKGLPSVVQLALRS